MIELQCIVALIRSPFLSRDLIEYSQKIPINLKINNGISKYLIKQILEKYLPKNLIYRLNMVLQFLLKK